MGLDMKPNIEMNEYTEDDIINISDRTFENSQLKMAQKTEAGDIQQVSKSVIRPLSPTG